MGEHDGHRARMKERFLAHGLDNFEDHNILELLLFYAQPRCDTNGIAHRLLDTFGTLSAVFDAEPEELMTVKGVGRSAAALIRLVPAAARRYLMSKGELGTILHGTECVGRFMIPRFMNSRTEEVYLLCLDPKYKLLDCRLVGEGGLTSAKLDIRRIVHTALLHNAAYAILAHNHISGIALPSPEDKSATLMIRDALRLVDVELIDHIIVAGEDFVSLADDGLLGQT